MLADVSRSTPVAPNETLRTCTASGIYGEIAV